jgi:pyridoxal phosphate enzyme (YggS family)
MERSALIEERIARACRASGRKPQDVRLIWVSKTKPIEMVQGAYMAGARDFGENKVQEVVEKFSEREADMQVHVIGPVQSNKIRKAVERADWVHTLHRYKDIDRWQRVCKEEKKIMKVLLQINVSGEDSKSGVPLAEAREFLENLPMSPNLLYCGLMTIGINTGIAEDSRAGFLALRDLRDEFLGRDDRFSDFRELSMGMTDDLEVAVESGATMVRIGTALFGARDYTQV